MGFGARVCPLLQPVGGSGLGYTVQAAPDMEKPRPQPGVVSLLCSLSQPEVFGHGTDKCENPCETAEGL